MSSQGYNDNQQLLIRKAIELTYSGEYPFNVEVGEDVYKVGTDIQDAPMIITDLKCALPLEGVCADQFAAIAAEVIDNYPKLLLSEQDKADLKATADFMIAHGSPYEIDNRLAPSSIRLTLESGQEVYVAWATHAGGRLPRLTADLSMSGMSIKDTRKQWGLDLQIKSFFNTANSLYLHSYVKEYRVLELTYEDCVRLFRLGYFCILVASSGETTLDGNDQSEIIYLVEIMSNANEQNLKVSLAPIVDRATWNQYQVVKSRRI